MSAPPRSFFFRFTLALLGMLLLAAMIFTGLGWMAVKQRGWLDKALGEKRTGRVFDWYLDFMANLFPEDRDRDGVCDGAELFMKTDPQNPRSTPAFRGHCLSHPNCVLACCGERTTVRWVQDVWVGRVRWPRGFRAIVSADDPVLLPKGGVGPPTKGPLLVAVNDRGQVEVDVLAESVIEDSFPGKRVTFANAANGKPLDDPFAIFPGWRLPSIPVAVDFGPARALVLKSEMFRNAEAAMQRMAPNRGSRAYLIEAAPEDGAGGWRTVGVGEIRGNWASLLRSNNCDYFPGYAGPLKFRVVPVSATPP